MSNLWNPSKQDETALRSGSRKIALHWLKREKSAKEVDCSFCGRRVLILIDKTMLTLNGSSHNCAQKKLIYKYHGEKI